MLIVRWQNFLNKLILTKYIQLGLMLQKKVLCLHLQMPILGAALLKKRQTRNWVIRAAGLISVPLPHRQKNQLKVFIADIF
jgi:hypothetical protein